MDNKDEYILVGDGFMIPKRDKLKSEDAFFVTERGAGVSDGVSSWSNYGIDSSQFSN